MSGNTLGIRSQGGLLHSIFPITRTILLLLLPVQGIERSTRGNLTFKGMLLG